MYDSGDDVVFFDLMGPPREFVGQKAICEQIKQYLVDFAANKDAQVDVIELKVISDGKLALARSVQHLTAKGPDGKPIDLTYRVTDVWRKTDGQWKMILTHASFPVDMKTGKADMASKM